MVGDALRFVGNEIISGLMDAHHRFGPQFLLISVVLIFSGIEPFDAGGYARVNLGAPDMFIRFRQKGIQQEACSWAVGNMDLKSRNSITWQVPCGNDMHTVAVSSITFGIALVCALLIVVSSIYFSAKNTKGS